MTPALYPRHVSLLLPLALLGCPVPEPEDTAADKAACSAPTVAEIEDLSLLLGQTATLQGVVELCDAACTSPTYSWSLDSAPIDSELNTSSFNIADPAAPYFTPDVPGTYVVSLYVTDCESAKSNVVYTVITVEADNAKPIADCGPNMSATAGERVDLDGSSSSDPEGDALTYDWSLSSRPDCSALDDSDVFNGDSSTASLVPDCEGVYVASLVVSDGISFSEPDYCAITVANDNAAPIADAGDSTQLSPCTAPDYHLDGWGSYDPDGDPLTFSWTLLSKPTDSSSSDSSFNDATAADPYFHWDVPGDYTFQLQVHDGSQYSAPDVVTYTFVDESENARPVANAGDDLTISDEPDCETASYVFTCEDCAADSVEADGSASTDPVDGDSLDFYWTETTGELTISAPYSPVTEILVPAWAADYGVTTDRSWTVNLSVSDCSESDEDTLTVTYSCTPTYAP